MTRLTHYNEKDKRYDIKNAYLEDLEQDLKYDGIAWLRIYEAYQELGKLEDIEEELGIDFITLFKALKNGFWSIDKNKHIYKMKRTKGNGGAMMFYVSIDCIIKEDAYDEEYFLLKDYGKTWALTRRELEK